MSKFIKTFFTCLTISCSIYFLIFTAIRRQDKLDQFKEKSAILNNKINSLDKELRKELIQKELIAKIIACESDGNSTAIGDNGKAYGIVQYHKATFEEHARKANLKNADWKNPKHQLYLLGWALNNNEGGKWTCYNKIKKEGSI